MSVLRQRGNQPGTIHGGTGLNVDVKRVFFRVLAGIHLEITSPYMFLCLYEMNDVCEVLQS